MNIYHPSRQTAVELLTHYLNQASQGKRLEGEDFQIEIEIEDLVDAIATYANHINDQ